MKHFSLRKKATTDIVTKQAEEMATKMGATATEDDVKRVETRMSAMKKGPLAKIWEKVVALWNAFKSPETPIALKAAIIGSLIYMVSPIDVVPDVMPILGLFDDVAVIGAAFTALEKMMPKIKETVTAVVKAGVSTGVSKALEHKAIDLTPEIDRLVLRQWIKTGIQLAAFILAVLILVFTAENGVAMNFRSLPFWGMYISALLLLATFIYYTVRACRVLPTFFQFLRIWRVQYRDKHYRGKSAIKHAIVETVFDHFHLDNTVTQRTIRFTVRSWADGRLDDWVPTDAELWNMVVHYFSRRVSAYVLSIALYFGLFIWTLRSSVLVGLTGMSFIQFICFPITSLRFLF